MELLTSALVELSSSVNLLTDVSSTDLINLMGSILSENLKGDSEMVYNNLLLVID